MPKYRKAFYRSLESQALTSAREVLPFVFDLIKPRSVVDVGCGTGEWLSVCQELGVEKVIGLDFHAGDYLKIPRDAYSQQDLKKPFTLRENFDLAISLEVGEHLAPECAEGFVDSITNLSSAVLFSAAIPSQGGTGHVNEQWPDYWANLFEKFHYKALDCLRPQFWSNQNVTCYYAQNAVLYVKTDFEFSGLPSFEMRRFVHPGLFEDQAKELKQLRPLFTLRGLVKRLPGALWLSVADRIRHAIDR